eukprot:UN23385
MHKTERIYVLESKIRYRTRNQPGGLRFSIISCTILFIILLTESDLARSHSH